MLSLILHSLQAALPDNVAASMQTLSSMQTPAAHTLCTRLPAVGKSLCFVPQAAGLMQSRSWRRRRGPGASAAPSSGRLPTARRPAGACLPGWGTSSCGHANDPGRQHLGQRRVGRRPTAGRPAGASCRWRGPRCQALDVTPLHTWESPDAQSWQPAVTTALVEHRKSTGHL